MADFRLALSTIFHHEGRYVDNALDKGGPTDYGISLSFLKKTGDLDHDGWQDGDINHDHQINVEDIKSLSIEDAEHLYKMYFWDPNDYEKIHDQFVATKLFDLAVNMGGIMANKISQRAVRSASRLILNEDGILGIHSLARINIISRNKLIPAINSEAAGYYRLISALNPKLKVFLNGWLNRAYSYPIFPNGESSHV